MFRCCRVAANEQVLLLVGYLMLCLPNLAAILCCLLAFLLFYFTIID